MWTLLKQLKLKVTAIVDAALEGLASLTQQDFAAVLPTSLFDHDHQNLNVKMLIFIIILTR